ncbi:MAG TPA: hypothetical protein VGH99_11080, partial [Pseudonocardia sp.]
MLRDAVPRVRGLVVALSCATGAVLGLTGASLADGPLAGCPGAGVGTSTRPDPTVRPGRPDPTVRPENASATACAAGTGGAPAALSRTDRTTLARADPRGPRAGRDGFGPAGRDGGAADPPAPFRRESGFTATATRHIPPGGRHPAPGQPDPDADRAMVLLVGWTMLVLVGGGLCAGRPRSRTAGRAVPGTPPRPVTVPVPRAAMVPRAAVVPAGVAVVPGQRRSGGVRPAPAVAQPAGGLAAQPVAPGVVPTARHRARHRRATTSPLAAPLATAVMSLRGETGGGVS